MWGDINFSTHSISFCLSSSPPLLPPPPSLPPSFHLSSAVLRLICHRLLKSLWISENIPRSAAMDELILTLCRCIGGQVSVWDTYSFCPNTLSLSLSLQAYDRLIKYYTSATKSITPNNKKENTISPVSEWVWMRKSFLFSAAEEEGRDFVSVTSNWVRRACFYLSKYLLAHKPEYSQRSGVRQSKQDGPLSSNHSLDCYWSALLSANRGSGVFLSFRSERAPILRLFWLGRSYSMVFFP